MRYHLPCHTIWHTVPYTIPYPYYTSTPPRDFTYDTSRAFGTIGEPWPGSQSSSSTAELALDPVLRGHLPPSMRLSLAVGTTVVASTGGLALDPLQNFQPSQSRYSHEERREAWMGSCITMFVTSLWRGFVTT